MQGVRCSANQNKKYDCMTVFHWSLTGSKASEKCQLMGEDLAFDHCREKLVVYFLEQWNIENKTLGSFK